MPCPEMTAGSSDSPRAGRSIRPPHVAGRLVGVAIEPENYGTVLPIRTGANSEGSRLQGEAQIRLIAEVGKRDGNGDATGPGDGNGDAGLDGGRKRGRSSY